MEEIKHLDFFGLKLSVFEDSMLIRTINEHIQNKKKLICYGYNFGMFPYFIKYPEIPEFANKFDIMISDGRGYYLLARLLGYPVKSDLSIPFLVNKVLDLANEKHYSILLLGSREEINQQASDKIRLKYPGVKVIDGHHGYFNEYEEANIVDYINFKKPDILLIGISSPKKERFAYKWRNNLNCSIIIPCGGVIDILAGFKNPTPRIIKKIGFAWLYRFVQEPKRLFRDSILNLLNVLFLMLPSLFFSTYVLRRKFSIPRFYNKSCSAPNKQ